MKGLPRFLCCTAILSVLPLMSNAAGTYYNGNLYQNPQSRYSTKPNVAESNAGGFYNTYGAGRGYGQSVMQNTIATKKTVQTVKKTSTTDGYDKQGFQLGIGLAHEFANWDLTMKTAGSELRYDNLRWNVVDGEMAYYFGGSTPMQIKVGGRYGMQFGDSPMIDDDVTTGDMWTAYSDGSIEGTPALSIGTSKDGKQYGFNAAFGFTDLFKIGLFKMTPSIGYRYFKHELITKNNNGLMVEVVNSPNLVNCLQVQNGEIQCSPYIGFTNGGDPISAAGFETTDSPGTDNAVQATDIYGNTIYVMVNSNGTYVVLNDTSASQVDIGNTYYYEQSGTSHKYDTVWAGPYVALDMEYVIDRDNIVMAGFEFGLPTYESEGDQPYRFDWAHPTSVKDEGGFGDAYHLGFNAMWSSSISDRVMLSLGMTYDYYHVKDADATTYLNSSYYQPVLNSYEIAYEDNELTEEGIEYLNYLRDLKSNGWAMKSNSEIEAVYKSMGIRLGLTAKF